MTKFLRQLNLSTEGGTYRSGSGKDTRAIWILSVHPLIVPLWWVTVLLLHQECEIENRRPKDHRWYSAGQSKVNQWCYF